MQLIQMQMFWYHEEKIWKSTRLMYDNDNNVVDDDDDESTNETKSQT